MKLGNMKGRNLTPEEPEPEDEDATDAEPQWEPHPKPHPLAGKDSLVRFGGEVYDFTVEDWWDRVVGRSWKDPQGNSSAISYGVRQRASKNLPDDDEVVFGTIVNRRHIVHVTELIT